MIHFRAVISSEPYTFSFRQRRNTHLCSHQSTSSSAILPFDLRLASQCRLLIGTDAAQKRSSVSNTPSWRDSLAWCLSCFRDWMTSENCRLTCEFRAFTLIREIVQVITKFVYLYANSLVFMYASCQMCRSKTCQFFLGWWIANIFCKTFIRNFRFLDIRLELNFY